MISTSILLALALVGGVACLGLAVLFLWSTRDQAKARMERVKKTSKVDSDEDAQRSTEEDASCWRRHFDRLVFAYCVLFLSALSLLLVFGTSSDDVDRLAMFFGCLTAYYVVFYLASLLMCVREDEDFRDPRSYVYQQYYYRTCRSVGLWYAYVAALALTIYATATLRGNNPAHDATSFYHGPAVVVGYQGNHANHNGLARGATLTVGYSSAWACPHRRNVDWCEDDTVELNWCEVYDETGGARTRLQPTWRVWEGEDLWDDSGFTCAKGMPSSGGDDDDDNNENDDNLRLRYSSSPFDAPYLVNVFADCEGSCKVFVDDPVFRSRFYRVSNMRYLAAGSSLASLLFLGLAGFFRRKIQQQQEEGDDDSFKATAGVDLLPPAKEEQDVAASKGEVA